MLKPGSPSDANPETQPGYHHEPYGAQNTGWPRMRATRLLCARMTKLSGNRVSRPQLLRSAPQALLFRVCFSIFGGQFAVHDKIGKNFKHPHVLG